MICINATEERSAVAPRAIVAAIAVREQPWSNFSTIPYGIQLIERAGELEDGNERNLTQVHLSVKSARVFLTIITALSNESRAFLHSFFALREARRDSISVPTGGLGAASGYFTN